MNSDIINEISLELNVKNTQIESVLKYLNDNDFFIDNRLDIVQFFREYPDYSGIFLPPRPAGRKYGKTRVRRHPGSDRIMPFPDP